MPAHTPEFDQRLTALWNEEPKLPTAEIGRRLGVSKNAVVGRAHRLGLPPRPSPIRRSGEPPKPPQPRLVRAKPTLPVMASTKPAPVVVVPPPRQRKTASCCWPIGEPGTSAFRFCDAESVPGKPYCVEHCGLAFERVRPSDRQEGNRA